MRSTASSGPTVGQVDDHPRPARAAARRRGHGRLLGGDPWRDAVDAAPPAGLRARRRRPVAQPHRRRGDRPARPPARRARPGPPRRAARAVRPRPDQEGPGVLEGQPAEGRAGRRARRRRRAADPRRADVRARPADGGGVPGRASARSRPTGRTVLLSSHILAEVEALCDRVTIIRAGRTVESGTLAELRHLTRTSITAETATRCRRARRRCPACTTSGDARAPRATFDVDTGAARRGRRAARHARACASLTSQPPTLEELFLRHYGDERPPPRPDGPTPSRPIVTAFAGTPPSSASSLRRDRVRLPVWILGIVAARRRHGVQRQGLYPTPADLVRPGGSVSDNTGDHRPQRPGRRPRHARRRRSCSSSGRSRRRRPALMNILLVARHTRSRGGDRAGRAGPRRRPSAAGRRSPPPSSSPRRRRARRR